MGGGLYFQKNKNVETKPQKAYREQTPGKTRTESDNETERATYGTVGGWWVDTTGDKYNCPLAVVVQQ